MAGGKLSILLHRHLGLESTPVFIIYISTTGIIVLFFLWSIVKSCQDVLFFELGGFIYYNTNTWDIIICFLNNF